MYKKLLSLCLTVSLCVTGISPAVFAQSSPDSTSAEYTSVQDNLYETDALRDQNTKVFKLRNGNNLAYISSTPLHFESDGEWKEIDNTLTLNEEEEYTNQQNSMQVRLPKQIGQDENVTVEKDNMTVSFRLLGSPNSADSELQQPKSTAYGNSKDNVPVLDYIPDEKLASEIQYNDVFNNIDVNYQVQSSSLKEELILNRRPTQELSFSYTIDCDGLSPILNEDNSISFYKIGTDEILFIMPAPIMFDSASEPASSGEITVSLSQSENGYQLQLTPSFTWLTDEVRVYPVSVDPTITDPIATIRDTFVSAVAPQSNFDTYGFTEVSSSKIALYRLFVNNWIDDGARVEKVNFYISPYLIPESSLNCEAHQILSDWDYKTVTWETKPEIDQLPMDSVKLEKSTKGYVKLDISKAYREADGSPFNFGFALMTNDKTSNQYFRVYSRDYFVENTRPFYTIEFKNVTGINSNYAQRQFNIGKAGTVFLNDYTGGLSLKRNDIGIDGLQAPVNISMVYSPENRSYRTQSAPSGAMIYMQTNYNLPLRHDGRSGRDYEYTWYNENGNIIYFRYAEADGPNNETTRYVDTDGLGYTLEKRSNAGINYHFELYDPSGNSYGYDALGRLEFINYKNQHGSVSVYYRDANSKYIDYITDGDGRKYKYIYQTIPNATEGWDQLISEIDYYGTGETILSKVIYTYDQNYQLSSVNYPGEGTVFYGYDSNGYLCQITDITGKQLRITYANGKAVKIEETKSNIVSGDTLTISYDYRKTAFTNGKGQKQIEHFDEKGKVAYITDQDNDLIQIQGDAKQSGLMQASSKSESRYNYLKNSGFENGSTVYSYLDFPSISYNFNNTDAHSGNKSLSIQLTSGAPMPKVLSQDFTLKSRTLQFSAWVKSSGSIYLTLRGMNEHFDSEVVNTNNEWQQISVTGQFSENSVGNTATAEISINQNCQVLIDDLQVTELGSYSLNLVQNPNFQEGLSNWDFKNIYLIANLPANKQNHSLRSGMAFRSAGSGDSAWAKQRVNLHEKKGEYYSFGGWASSQYLLPFEYNRDELIENQRTFGMRVIAYNAANQNEKETYLLSFNPYIEDLQYASSGFALPFDANYVDISFIYFNQNYGDVYFMGAELIKLMDAVPDAGETDPDTDEDAPYTEEKEGQRVVKRTYKNGSVETYQYESAAPFSQTGSKLAGANAYLQQNFTYTPDGNYMTSVTDASGRFSEQTVDTNTGLLQTVNRLEYVYDDNNRLTTIRNKSLPRSMFINFSYSNGRISGIEHYGMQHSLTYSPFGELESLSYGSGSSKKNQFTNTFDKVTQQLTKQTFGNGQTIQYGYTAAGQLNSITQNGVLAGTIEYSDMGTPYRITDKLLNRTYIENNGWAEVYSSNASKYGYKFQDKDSHSAFELNSYYRSSADYSKDEELGTQSMVMKGSSLYAGKSTTYFHRTSYDILGRKTAVTVNSGSTYGNPFLSTNYGYATSSDGKSSTRVGSEDIVLKGSHIYQRGYSYDSNGKITSTTKNSVPFETYVYSNSYNYLNSYTNAEDNVKIKYSYDRFNNLKTITKTNLTTGSVLESHSYTYDTTGDWTDQIKTADGKSVLYDVAGNVTGYGNLVFGWGSGNRLTSIGGDGKNILYSYDMNGKLSHVSGNKSASYTWNGDKLLMSNAGSMAVYHYDANNQVVSVTFNDTEYYYVRNQLGDVVMLVDGQGNIVVSYKYDPFGNILSVSGSMASTLGKQNPFRYRGYFYEEASGFYLLGNRFYNPLWGRFLSPDTVIDCNTYLGLTFIYCYGDPVNFVDYNGYYSINIDYNPYNTSYSLENQHWHKYHGYYGAYSKDTRQESVSSLNLTPHERQEMTGFQRFIMEVATIACSKSLPSQRDYIKQLETICTDIGIGASIITFFINPPVGMAFTAISLTLSIYLRLTDETISINPIEQLYEYMKDDNNIKPFRDHILPLLIEIQIKYAESDRLNGNFANIFLNCGDNFAEMKIEITDWVGAVPNTKHPLQSYKLGIRKDHYFAICDILNKLTYVYTKSVSQYGYTYEISYPY